MTETIEQNQSFGLRHSGLRLSASQMGNGLAALLAGVWFIHGLYNKILGGSPRHVLIVQSVLGFSHPEAQVATKLIGIMEVLIGLWLLSGRSARACATVQSTILIAMNVLELSFARHLLLWPAGLIPINLIFLGLVWLSVELRNAPDPTNTIAKPPRCGSLNPLYRLQRHPIPIEADFRHCLVLTYAIDRRSVEPLLPPGLELDTWNDFAFLAVAMVQTEALRPAGWPRVVGRNFFLAGYRLFTRFKMPDGRTRRGLRILRSDADRAAMVVGGNLLTHYNYHQCDANVRQTNDGLEITVRSSDGASNLHVRADLSLASHSALPAGSPFGSLHEALRFAGPMPWTFDYEPQTHSIVAIRGVREQWRPRMVPVSVLNNTFIDRIELRRGQSILASAFYTGGIHYRWERGVRYPLSTSSEVRS